MIELREDGGVLSRETHIAIGYRTWPPDSWNALAERRDLRIRVLTQVHRLDDWRREAWGRSDTNPVGGW